MKNIRITIFLLLAIILFNQRIMAQAGSLDRTFGDTGLLVTELLTDVQNKSLIQGDGKILVYGGQFNAVVRLNPDGNWDESFGIAGIAHFANDSIGTYKNNFALQSDGKIVCAGQFARSRVYGIYLSCVLRLNADGSLDSSFGKNGIDTLRIDKLNAPTGIVVQPDGKIVVSGDVGKSIYDEKRTFLYRLMPDGGLDPSFGESGIVINHDPNSMESAALVLRPNGKLIIGSISNIYGEYEYYQLRSFNPDGSVDAGFGDNGIANYNFGEGLPESWTSVMKAMVLQPDGKIVCTGTSGIGSPKMALCRFNEDGSIDVGFGENGGIIITNSDSLSAENNDITLQPDGKIITSGIAYLTELPIILVRYTEDGHLDPSFGDNGIVETYNSSPSYLAGKSVHVLTDGKILVTGYSETPNWYHFLMLARYNGDNVLASNFKEVKAIQENDNITITWQTLNENNTKSYTVERSNNAKDYAGINTIPAKHAATNSYSYTDKNPLYGDNYYRIKENAVNGTFNYSQTLRVNFENSNIISLYPNPAKNNVTIKGLNKNATAIIKITDMNGREISKQNFSNTSSTILSIKALAQGSYFILVEQNGKQTKLRLVKE